MPQSEQHWDLYYEKEFFEASQKYDRARNEWHTALLREAVDCDTPKGDPKPTPSLHSLVTLMDLTGRYGEAELEAYSNLLKRRDVPPSRLIAELDSRLELTLQSVRTQKWLPSASELNYFFDAELSLEKAWNRVSDQISDFVHNNLQSSHFMRWNGSAYWAPAPVGIVKVIAAPTKRLLDSDLPEMIRVKLEKFKTEFADKIKGTLQNEVESFFCFAIKCFDEQAAELFQEVPDVHLFRCAVWDLAQIVTSEFDRHQAITAVRDAHFTEHGYRLVAWQIPSLEKHWAALDEKSKDWLAKAEKRNKENSSRWIADIRGRLPLKDISELRKQFESYVGILLPEPTESLKENKRKVELNWNSCRAEESTSHWTWPWVENGIGGADFGRVAANAAKLLGYAEEDDWFDILRLHSVNPGLFHLDWGNGGTFQRIDGEYVSFRSGTLADVASASVVMCRLLESEEASISELYSRKELFQLELAGEKEAMQSTCDQTARKAVAPSLDRPVRPASSRSPRTPDLDTSRERLKLVGTFAYELATIKQDLKGYCTPDDLTRKYPTFLIWGHLEKAEIKELADGVPFIPRAYAENLTLRKYGITSRETLKKDRRKIRQSQKFLKS